jgi:hypothetical protein
MLLPAEVWSAPDHDLDVTGFDPPTIFADEAGNRYDGEALGVLTNGDWTSCPCDTGIELSLLGQNLSPETAGNPAGVLQLAGIEVLLDGVPTRVFAVGPRQVNFFLGENAKEPGTTVTLKRHGAEVGRLFVPIGEPMTAAATSPVVAPEQIQLVASPGQKTAVHLVTSPRLFEAAFDLTVDAEGSGAPVQVMLWSPRNFSALRMVFGASPSRSIEVYYAENRTQPESRNVIGSWTPGEAYRVTVSRAKEQATFSVHQVGSDEPPGIARFATEDAPKVFDGYRPSLSVLANSDDGTATVSLSEYRLRLAHERFLSVRIADKTALWIAVILLAVSAMAHLPMLLRGLRHLGRKRFKLFAPDFWWLLPAAGVLAVGVALVGPLASHPFDMSSQTLWTYLLTSDGIGDLYYRAQTVPLAAIWNGIPYHEGVYPYGVSMSYYFAGIGQGYQLLGGTVAPDDAGLEMAIKAANTLVALADAVLIFLLARGYGRRKLAWLVPAAFLLNPALLFDLLVWGETETVALFFLLASLLAAQRGAPRLAWPLLALAILGKQTMAVPVVLAGVYYLRIFRPRDIVDGLSIGAAVALAAVLPFIAVGYSPSIAVDPILGAFNVFGGSDAEQVFRVVSYDSFSVWPLVTKLHDGQTGIDRLNYPDYIASVGGLTYQQIGVLAFFGVLVATILWLLFSKRVTKEPGLIFVAMAFVMAAELILPTRSIARYLVFPIVFAIIGSSAQTTSKRLWFAVASLTATSLLGMYGSVGSGLETNPALGPSLAPESSAVTRIALELFRSDLVITIGSVVNIAALLALGSQIWLPRARMRAVSSAETAVQPEKREMPQPLRPAGESGRI